MTYQQFGRCAVEDNAQTNFFPVLFCDFSVERNWHIFSTSFVYFFHLKTIIMRSILYIIAVILVIGWLLGFFVYSATGLIHILLVLAVISLLLALIGGRGTP